MPYTTDDLLKMSTQQLDDLFRQYQPGDIPNGEAQGTAIIAEGTPFSPVIAQIINIFGWQGKTFDAVSGRLVNRLTFFGLSAIVAKNTLRQAGSMGTIVSFLTIPKHRWWLIG